VGSIVFGLAHGFVSPGLFILVGAVLYDKCGSRIINYYRGLTDLNPVFAIVFLLFIFGNMSVPLTGNFIGEFLSLLGSYQLSIFVTTVGATSIILSAVYSIFTYNRVVSGAVSPYIFTIPDMYRKEFYMILPLLLLTFALGIYPTFITSDIEFGLSHSLLFSLSPVIFSKGGKPELPNGGNPHNTPIIDAAVPPAPTTRNRNPNNDDERPSSAGSDQSTTSESSDSGSNGSGIGYDPNYVGNPISDEGRPLFVPLDDRRNQPVDAGDLHARLQGILNSEQVNGEESDSDSSTDFASSDRTNLNTRDEERESSGIRNREEIVNNIPINTPRNTPVTTSPSTLTNTPNNTPINTNTPTNTPVNTNTPTNTPVYGNTPNNTPVNSDDENSRTNTPVYGNTPNNTPVDGNTPINGNTPNNTPVDGNTPINGNTPNNTPVDGNTPNNTPVYGNTPNNTPVNGNTPNNTPINGNTPNNTPVNSDDEYEEDDQTGSQEETQTGLQGETQIESQGETQIESQGGAQTESQRYTQMGIERETEIESQREVRRENFDTESEWDGRDLGSDIESETSENYFERHSGRRNRGLNEQESETTEDRDNNSNISSSSNSEGQDIENQDNNKEVSEKDKG